MTGHFPTREAAASHQLARLRQLLGAILPGNAFYRNKLARIDPAIASLEDFSARFPFTTKQELVEDQRRQPPFGSNLTFPPATYTRYHQTSGTTSSPLRWLDTPESWDWMVESWKEIYRAAGVGGGDRVYFACSFGPFIGFWLAFEAAQRLGCLCLPGGGLSTQGRLRALSENRATVLCCTPSYAAHLAEVAAREKLDLRSAAVRVIIVAGEPGGSVPAARRRLEELWPGARIFDHHGMTETGPVSHECPAHPGTLHILEQAYLAEIIGADGKAARPGEAGELVLTVLGRAGSPLEHAIYDPDSRMLKGFLSGLAAHLEPGGEGWLILSDLAEHLGLRSRAELLALMESSGLQVISRNDVKPHHPRASDQSDPLHHARAAEVTSLWRLAAR